MINIINRVEVIPIRIPNRSPIKLANIVLRHQDNVIVRVWSGGVCGIGETEPFAGFQGCNETHGTVVPLIRNGLASEVIGMSPFDAVEISAKLDKAAPDSPYARNGLVNAIYDLAARLRGVPLCEYLGKSWRDKLPVVWTIGIKESPQEMAKEAISAIERGYRLLKLKVGGRPIAEDFANVAAIRDAVGGAIGIRVDANGGLTYENACALLERLQPLNIDLIEQPLGIAELDGMSKLTAAGVIPIMPDESLTSVRAAREIVRLKAASIFGMKLAKHGGIFHGLEIAEIARKAGIPVYPGNQPSTSVGSANAAHFFSSIEIATLGGDFHIGPAGWLGDDIVKRPLVIENGFALVPEGPGIGMELDEAKLAKYAVSV